MGAKNSSPIGYLRESMAPILVVYLLIGGISLAFFRLAGMEDVTFWVDLIKAAPFAFSAIIVGAFSVLFWALNYLARNHRKQLRVSEARELFDIRDSAIEKVLGEDCGLNITQRTLLKAHILFSSEEIQADPEVPSSPFGLTYSEVVSNIMKRS